MSAAEGRSRATVDPYSLSSFDDYDDCPRCKDGHHGVCEDCFVRVLDATTDASDRGSASVSLLLFACLLLGLAGLRVIA